MSPTMTAAFTKGEQVRLIPVEKLQTLKQELRAFREGEALNGFQRWILDEKFTLEVPPCDHAVRSILLVAIAHRPWANVELDRRGRRIRCLSLAVGDFDDKARELGERLAAAGLRLTRAPELPLKRLAARSGLAAYGRNNICYAEGLGSHFFLAAFFTDVPCEDGPWLELRMATACDHCAACRRSCPTGAIREDRFLIDNERCLSYLNESPGPFPAWLSASAHHALYDCLRCQQHCPMNRTQETRLAATVRFDEEETEALLAAVPAEQRSPALREKARAMGLDQWPAEAIARNVRVLLEQAEVPA